MSEAPSSTNSLLAPTDMKLLGDYLDGQTEADSKQKPKGSPNNSVKSPTLAGLQGYRSQLEGWSPAVGPQEPTSSLDKPMESLSLDGSQATATATATTGNDKKEQQKKEKKPQNIPANIQPKKKLSKKERRELQEAQRAAKAANLSQSSKQSKPKSSIDSERGGKVMQYDDAKKVARRSKVSVVQLTKARKQVTLFSHLPQYERENSLTLNVGFSNNEIHPAILSLGLKYAQGRIVGGNARCHAMLRAFQKVIQDYSTPPDKMLSRDLDKKLRPLIQFLIDCRPHSISMGNAIRYARNVIATVPPECSEEEAKDIILQKIDTFIEERIQIAMQAIVEHAVTKIADGDVILTYARSVVLETLFKRAYDQGRKFRVIVVDSNPLYEGKLHVACLSEYGISCSYVMINALGYIMPEVTKVFLGASSFMSNGVAIARAGTANIAMTANSFHVPVIFCCETYKFSDRVQTDSITQNELGDPDQLLQVYKNKEEDNPLADWRDIDNLTLLNLIYDVTPMKHISMVVTEVGMTPPTSIPVIIREYRKEATMGKTE